MSEPRWGTVTLQAALEELAETRRKLERAEELLAYFGEQYGRLLAIHEQVVMDTPEDQELHEQTIAAFKRAVGMPDTVEEPEPEVPFVAIGAGERAPWEDLSLNCPVCGEGPLPLQDSDPPMLSFISHCDKTWVRGPFRPDIT